MRRALTDEGWDEVPEHLRRSLVHGFVTIMVFSVADVPYDITCNKTITLNGIELSSSGSLVLPSTKENVRY